MKFMHRSNQIKHNKKIILTRTHKTRLHIDPNVFELDTSVIGYKNLTMQISSGKTLPTSKLNSSIDRCRLQSRMLLGQISLVY